ncbi:type IV pilus twitching motility protein PilT [Anaeromyxobacter dehalogenans]|uniref:Twitching motility protein n=1 Tax=Anaeromyxobacter dehalogenans (strain 2CP-C) TaxID=290397 RepID=Q2ILF7_ANADE|nr:PilT/PilU family type 4a pilus ATPase [Anaeromyxobacter dehalogenans]ABC82484.1 twitching motility protein [Anaeromyxobacter dehalogenans 2CP-C]
MEGQGPLSEELFHSFLQLAVKRQASDVHFEVGYPPTYRVFGELLSAKYPPLTHADTEAIANFVLQAPGSGFTPLDFREVDRSYSLPGVSRFRASIFKQRGSWGAVMRTIPFQIPDFDTLNLPPVIRTIAEARRGLICVTGATGNGKSTTVASIINTIIQQERLHVVTVEDPIEFIFAGGKGLVIQREVGSDTASYSDALRAALRQDPDIIMVGELRDREAADICLKAAETGHLVITSLHTPDVPRAVGRIVGLFPADEQDSVRARLADNLQAVIALRLLMRADATGLIPAVESLLATTSVRELIRDGSKINELRTYMDTAGADLGMHSFDQYLYRLHEAKRIGLDTALANATHRADLERRIMMETGGRPA